LIENVFGTPYSVFPSQNDMDLALLIGYKDQRTSGRNTQLGAEGVIVCVRAITKIAICVRELSPQVDRSTGYNLSAKKLDIPLLRQSPRSPEIRDERLHLCERHVV
jgi:hypothetical protein